MKKKLTVLFLVGFFIGSYAQEFDKLKSDLKREVIDTVKISLTLKLAEHYLEAHNDSSKLYIDQALKLASKSASPLFQAKASYLLAKFHENNNSYNKSIENYFEALVIYKKLDKGKKVAKIYNLIGDCYSQIYAENTAIKYYLKSLKLNDKLKNHEGIAHDFLDIGKLYYAQENYDSASKYFQNALKIYKLTDDKNGIAVCYTNIGNAVSDAGHYEAGLNYYAKSIELKEKIGDPYGVAINLNNIGDSYVELEQYSKALMYFNQSLDIANKTNEKNLISVVLLNISRVQNKLKNYEKSILYAKKSMQIAHESGYLDYEISNLENLIDAYEGKGDIKEAHKYHKIYKKIEDSLQQIDKSKKVQLFNALNELEEKEYTIDNLSKKNRKVQKEYKKVRRTTVFLIVATIVFALLIILLIVEYTSKKKAFNLLSEKSHQISRMNNEIQEQRDHLNKLNKTKDKFFSIIAHDLKNPFNSIKGFTELMIENNAEYDSEKRLKFLKIVRESSSKASSLLNNLLTWANAQSENFEFKPTKIHLKNEIESVVTFLEIQAVNKDIKIINEVADDIYVKADSNMLRTILRNLISNAIKFTNPRGSVRISASEEDNFIKIAVKDSGVGIPKSELDKLFNIETKTSTSGTANEQGSGLGLVLCKDFVQKHGGVIKVKSELNKGSEFTFTLPKWND
ncbi:tetratricopeptide repeat-containing sensor histidine kinase [Lutibacter sp.]